MSRPSTTPVMTFPMQELQHDILLDAAHDLRTTNARLEQNAVPLITHGTAEPHGT